MSLQLNGTNGVTYNDGTLQSSAPIQKNKIINGNFAINQRGVSGTVSLSAGAYGHDRFKAGSSGCTYTFATNANVTTITITAGSLQQVIEGVNLQSGTHVLSWTGTAQAKIDSGSYADTGVTATLTGGTNATVEFGTGTVTKAQLEVGSNASTFEQLQYGQQFALCQRYYQTQSIAVNALSTSGVTGFAFNTIMRAAPTITWSSGGVANRQYRIDNGAVYDVTSASMFSFVGGLNYFYSFSPSGWAGGAGIGFTSDYVMSAEL